MISRRASTIAAAGIFLAAAIGVAGCASKPAGKVTTPPPERSDEALLPEQAPEQRPDAPMPELGTLPSPATRAERSRFQETSSHRDVLRFTDSLVALGFVRRGSLATSTKGRDVPYFVAARPLPPTAAAIVRDARPVVLVQANIHAGEVEGKEAILALVRDLAQERRANVLDSIVLVVVPIYNADGNEQIDGQEVNRTEQNGPELVGERANGQGLDLNRDFIKAEAPETRGMLALMNAWDPDVYVDLHTTNGSYHGYALTYSPSLTPAAPLGAWTRDSLLPELRRRVRERRGYETFDYGNFALEYGADVTPDTTKQGWFSYDHRPRFGTNYYGLRGRVSILSEAYSHDPFERRVRATYVFVREILSLAAERGAAMRAIAASVDAGHSAPHGSGARGIVDVALRAELTKRPYVGDVLAEDLERTGDSTMTEPGVPRGLRRTGRVRTVKIPVHDRFDATLTRTLPAGWLVPAADTAALRLLSLHGVRWSPLASADVEVETFVLDSIVRSPRRFQGHAETRVIGRWTAEGRGMRTAPSAWAVVPASQPLARVAAYLLEPESDDGLTTWNVFDAGLRVGAPFPVRRLTRLPGTSQAR